jgi:hypothetical protein
MLPGRLLLRRFHGVLSESAENQNRTLDEPEHGYGADSVGRDEFGPARK